MNTLINLGQLVMVAAVSFGVALILGWLAVNGLFQLMPRLLPAAATPSAKAVAPKPRLVYAGKPARRMLRVIPGGA